jgi:hypothetical protein
VSNFADLFSGGLTEFSEMISAVTSLMLLPGYYSMLLILGFWIFVAGRKARRSSSARIDLNMEEFVDLRARMSGSDESKRSWLERLRKSSNSRGMPADNRSDIEERLETDESDSGKKEEFEEEIEEVPFEENGELEDAETGDKGDEENAGPKMQHENARRYSRMSTEKEELKEFAWPLPIHDFPLYIMSVIVVMIAMLLPALSETESVDPLFGLVSSLMATMLLPGFLTRGISLMLTVTVYTALGAIAIRILSRLIFRWLQLEWLHLQPPKSHRFEKVKRIWKYCGFVNLYRLDQSTALWLIPMLLMYILMIVALDIMAFYFHLDLQPTLLAAVHLLPIAMPRMFDQLWPHPVVFKRSPKGYKPSCEPEDLPEKIMGEEYLGELLEGKSVEQVSFIDIPGTNPLTRDKEEPRSRLKHLLGYMGREDLASFLQIVLDNNFEKNNSVVVTGPLGSGRREIIQAATFETIFRGNSCLVLVENSKHARKFEAELQRYSKALPALRAFKILRGGDPVLFEVEAFAKRVDILVCDFESLNQVIGNADYLHNFFDRLGLITLLDLDSLDLREKTELPLIIRRIQLLCDTPDFKIPILAAILDAARADHDSFFKLFHRDFVQVPLGYAGDVRISFYRIPLPTRNSLGPYSDNSILMRFGSALMDAGYPIFFRDVGPINPADISKKDQAVGTDNARILSGSGVVISLVKLNPITYIEQLSRIRELGRLSNFGQHFCFLICDDDAWNSWLLQKISTLVGYRGKVLTPQLIPSGEAKHLSLHHLVRAVMELKAVKLEELGAAFGQNVLLTLLDYIVDNKPSKQISDELAAVLDLIEVAEDIPRGKYLRPKEQLEAGFSRFRLDLQKLDVSKLKIHCAELDLAKTVETRRQPMTYWPQKIFDFEGARVRIFGKPVNGVVSCIPEPEELHTTKIRRLFIDAEQSLDLTRDHLFNKTGIGICRTVLDVTEEIKGYRTWRENSLVLETVYNSDEQSKCCYRAPVVVIFLPGLTADAAHLFAHLLRHYLMLILGQADEFFDVSHGCFESFSVAVSENKYHDVTLVEYVDGGIGIADMVTPVLIHKLAAFIDELDNDNVAWWRIHCCHSTKLTRFDNIHTANDSTWDGTTAELLMDFLRSDILAHGKSEEDDELSFDNIVWWRETEIEEKEESQSDKESEETVSSQVVNAELIEKVEVEAKKWKAIEN